MTLPARGELPRFQGHAASVRAAIAVDRDGLVSYCNALAEGLTGWPAAEALNRPLDAVFDLSGALPCWQPRRVAHRAMDHGAVVRPATYGLLRNRSELELLVEYSATPIRARDGQVTGAMVVFRDVTGQFALHLA